MVCVGSIGMLGQCPLAHRTLNASFTQQCCERVVLMELEARWLNSLNVKSCILEYIAFLECVRTFVMFRRCHLALAHLRSPKLKHLLFEQTTQFLHFDDRLIVFLIRICLSTTNLACKMVFVCGGL